MTGTKPQDIKAFPKGKQNLQRGKKQKKDDTFVIQFVKVNHFEINKKRLMLITLDAEGIVHTKIIK